ISIYAFDNNVFINSKGDAAYESGIIEIFNLTGQKIHEQQLSAGSRISIPVNVTGNYIIVRVIKASETKTEKIFIR
ncbi:MAG: T9SS type A sorting domain-containing protein, partial [Bacteroidales bacterium]|nr:T9SS type A sorting domain-containing protein [Bacteroidales bacterium]